jgi:hypothetical protein
MISQSLKGVHKYDDKKDVLTVWKARQRRHREVPVADMDIFSNYDHIKDRRMIDMTEKWWGLGLPT